MKYQDVLNYILNIPMFQNVGQSAYNPSLDKITDLCSFLGNPQNSFRSIHVAGTNGKGSSANMLCSILQESGFKTGLYTSPHLVDYRERITVCSQMISEKMVCDFMDVAYDEIERLKPSFFEFTTALAFWAFRETNVDIAVIETGLGGRIDSTNIIKPIVSLITNIGIDHKAILGSTIEEITVEKVGIIKPKTPVVICEVLEQNRDIFFQKAKDNNAEIYFAQDNLCVVNIDYDNNLQCIEVQNSKTGRVEQYELAMLGEYQSKNLLGVLTVVDVLNNQLFGYDICIETIKRAIRKCEVVGRWQVISQNPYKVCDVGHNFDGISQVVNMITKRKYRKLYMILGFMQDKEFDDIINILPKEAYYIAVEAPSLRSLKCADLCSKLQANGFNVSYTQNVKDAVSSIDKIAEKNDMIFIGGSSFVVADYMTRVN